MLRLLISINQIDLSILRRTGLVVDIHVGVVLQILRIFLKLLFKANYLNSRPTFDNLVSCLDRSSIRFISLPSQSSSLSH